MARKNKNVKKVYNNNYYKISSAYTYDSFPLEDTYNHSTKKKLKNKKPQIIYVHSDMLAKKPSLSFYLSVILIFICAISTSVSIANVSLQRTYNQTLGEQLRRMENTTSNLTIEVSGARNLDEIKFLALTRLGMAPPEPHQIIYINVPSKSSYDEYPVLEPINEGESFITRHLQRIRYYMFKD